MQTNRTEDPGTTGSLTARCQAVAARVRSGDAMTSAELAAEVGADEQAVVVELTRIGRSEAVVCDRGRWRAATSAETAANLPPYLPTSATPVPGRRTV